MVIDATEVLARANELYGEYKGSDEAIRSDQVKATIVALVEAINKELFNPIVVHCEASADGEEA